MIKNVLIRQQWMLFMAFSISISAFSQKAPLGKWEILKISKNDSMLLANTWKEIVNSIRTKNYEHVKTLSLQNIYGEYLDHIWPGFSGAQIVSIDSFINIAFIKNNNKHFIDVITDSTYRLKVTKYQDRKFPNFKLKHDKNIVLYDVYYIDYVPTGKRLKDENYYVIRFVKVNTEYKLFGLSLEWPGAIK